MLECFGEKEPYSWVGSPCKRTTRRHFGFAKGCAISFSFFTRPNVSRSRWVGGQNKHLLGSSAGRIGTKLTQTGYYENSRSTDAAGFALRGWLAGYPVFSLRVIMAMAAFPVLWTCDVVIQATGMAGPRSLNLQTYSRRARGFWREWLWGVCGIRFPFRLETVERAG
jgi:hypothetical protein